MWFKNLSGRMGQNLRNLSKLTEKHYNLNSIVRLRIRLSVYTDRRIYIINVYTINRHAKIFVDVKKRLKKQLFCEKIWWNEK